MDMVKLYWKEFFLMLIFAGFTVAGLQLAGMWMWVLSSGAIPAYEGEVHIILSLIGAILAINGLLKTLAGVRSKMA